MVHPVKRRMANVQRVQQLMAGVGYIRYQKQIPNAQRIAKYMLREHGVEKAEVEKQLHYAVMDNLIQSYTGVGFKGSKTGIEYEGFRVPEAGEVETEEDGHDWYCFECHSPGEMYACSDCWRVFHPDCQDEDCDDVSYTCAVCRGVKSARKKKKTKRKLLNTLLSYTIVRLKEKTRELHRVGHREEEKKFMPLFVYKPMDLNKMEQKVMAHKYKCIEEFLADAHNVLHNMVLIYGDDQSDGMTELARIMIRDCKYDIDEMSQCQNCYYMSNAKPRHWFAQPCDPPHELVYAKLKGYSFWPAKVIRYLDDDKYDVRFFGGLHQRAVIPKDQIKAIDTDMKKQSIKKTAGFVKAEEELQVHKKLLQEKQEAEEEEEEEEEEEVQEPETDTVSSTSSSKRSKNKKVSSPEDLNVVTSTEEYPPPAKRPRLSVSSTASQTSKKHTQTPTKVSSTQTDPPVMAQSETPVPSEKGSDQVLEKSDPSPSSDDPPVLDPSHSDKPGICNCEVKHKKQMEELQDKLEREHKETQQTAMDELSERLRKDFEEDKQAAVQRAMNKYQSELEKVRRQTEDKCKEQYKDEMKKLAQKHKETISATKKKQWCYNCEEEAMYHCCWNTSYCSVKCQQEHWHKEHKRVCRRKR